MVRGLEGSNDCLSSEVEAVCVLNSFKTALIGATDMFLICKISLSAHYTPITSQEALAYRS